MNKKATPLGDCWNPSGFYEKPSGFLGENQENKSNIDHFFIEQPDGVYTTTERVTLTVGGNTTEGKGRKLIFLPGFSETTGQLKDIITLLLEQAQKFYNAPCQLIGLNPCGKATESYIDNAHKASQVSLKNIFKDVQRQLEHLIVKGQINESDELIIIGHSIGYLNALAALELLQEKRMKVKKIVGLMPATDKPMEALLSSRFLATVSGRIIDALIRAWTGAGLSLNYDEHVDYMFEENSELYHAHHERSNPDSALCFLNFTLRFKRIFKNILKNYEGEAYLFSSKKDWLLPAKMAENEAYYLRSLGIPTDHFEGQHFNHALPMDMTKEQRGEMVTFLRQVFNKPA